MKNIFKTAIAIGLLSATMITPSLARNGMMGGAPRFVPHFNGVGGFHGGNGVRYGFRRNFGYGNDFGFYNYGPNAYFTGPCSTPYANPYYCNQYQYGY